MAILEDRRYMLEILFLFFLIVQAINEIFVDLTIIKNQV